MPGNLLNASANKGNDVHNCFLSAFKEKYIQRLFLTYPLESSSRASRYSLQEEETYFDNFSTFADGVKQMKMTVTSPQLDRFFADRTQQTVPSDKYAEITVINSLLTNIKDEASSYSKFINT